MLPCSHASMLPYFHTSMLRTTMTGNRMNLWCVIDTESIPFPIKIESSESVGELKKAIKAAIPNTLKKIDANKLTLWLVAFPLAPNGERIYLREITSAKKLDPTDDLTDVFESVPSKKTVSIIVERPQPGSRMEIDSDSAFDSHNRKKERTKRQLDRIVNRCCQDHHPHNISQERVETAQKEQLGPFYKKPLPYYSTESSLGLPMLGLLRGKEPLSTNHRTLPEIVQSDLGETTNFSVVTLVGRSGSGKSATVTDLAGKHFVVYCVCCNEHSIESPEFKDDNFATLATDVEQICANIQQPNPNSIQDLLRNDGLLRKRVTKRVNLEFLARLLFLLVLFNINRNLQPLQFFREQTNEEGSETIEELVSTLCEYNTDSINNMLDEVQDKLGEYLSERALGLVIALDEAQFAATRILHNRFLTPSVLDGNPIMLDSKGRVKATYLRGFLTPLCAALSRLRATLVVLGTSMSLLNVERVHSAVGKRTNCDYIFQFPVFKEGDVQGVLSELVDLSECTIPPAKLQKMTGRARFSLSVVRELFEYHQVDPHTSKQAKLEMAVDSAIGRSKSDLQSKLESLLEEDRTDGTVRLLGRMVLAYKLQGGKVWFPSTTEADFVDKALCSLRVQSDGVYWLMEEPLVVKVVEKALQKLGVDAVFSEHLAQLDGIIGNLGVKSSAKGNALEPLVWTALQRFNGFNLVDLPFLKGIELPTWCWDQKLQIDDINTAHGYGYDDDTRADLNFLIDRHSNKLLVQKSGTRQDGAWFFSDTLYAGSLAVKFYSDAIPQSHHKSNETSSDIRRSFLQADGVSKDQPLSQIREDFIKHGGDKITGILRIHLELPSIKGAKPVTHVERNLVTGTEDVMVHINMENMDDFFYEGIDDKKEDVVHLKNLIRFVIAK